MTPTRKKRPDNVRRGSTASNGRSDSGGVDSDDLIEAIADTAGSSDGPTARDGGVEVSSEPGGGYSSSGGGGGGGGGDGGGGGGGD